MGLELALETVGTYVGRNEDSGDLLAQAELLRIERILAPHSAWASPFAWRPTISTRTKTLPRCTARGGPCLALAMKVRATFGAATGQT